MADRRDDLSPGRSWPRIDVRRSLPPTLAGALVALLVLAVSPTAPRTQTRAPAATLSSLPLAAGSLVSRTLGRDQGVYRIHRSGSGLVARNAPQALSARFGAHGVQVRSGEDTLSLRLRATGYGRTLQPVAAAAPAAHANRVSYRHGSVTEWYANGPLGLEQGFTLKAPPSGEQSGRVTLALSISGGLIPSLERGARSLNFAGSALRYAGLTAFDAGGQRLPARLALRGRTLVIHVNDVGARYPLTIDPFIQQAKLTTTKNTLLGQVALSDDTLVAGFGGAAYVFVKPAGGWANGTQTAKLTASDGFGLGSVAISGDTIVAGAPAADVSGHSSQGAAYVFVKPAGGWASRTQTAKLTASDGDWSDRLGWSVAIAGDTIVAGAPRPTGPHDAGAVYVFVRPAGGWADRTQTAKLTASQGRSLGFSVAISGDTIVAGAPYVSRAATEQGNAYVFVKPAGGWVDATQTARLTASNAAAYDHLGWSVAASGDTIVAGAQGPGYVYVFVEAPGGWASATQTAGLTAGSGQVISAGISGDTIAAVTGGVVCVFVKPPGGWASGTEAAHLLPASFTSIAIAGDTIVAGTFEGRAVAYVFRQVPVAITVTKHLVPAFDSGRFDLKVGGSVVKAAAGDYDVGSIVVAPGTYRVSESGVAGTSPSDYSTSIACTLNEKPGPVANGTTQLDVTVADGDHAACEITNRRKARVRLTKLLNPAADPGRFDLKVAGTVVKASAGNGDYGSMQLPAGTYRVSESAAAGTSLDDYAASIACTVNGSPGPSASGTTQLDVTVVEADVVKCALTNKRKAQVTLRKHLVPVSDPGRFDLKLSSSSQVKVVKTSAGDGDSGSVQAAPGTWTVVESAASGASLSDYTSSIACTRNGNSGPSGNSSSLQLTLSPADVLVCTITNQRK